VRAPSRFFAHTLSLLSPGSPAAPAAFLLAALALAACGRIRDPARASDPAAPAPAAPAVPAVERLKALGPKVKVRPWTPPATTARDRFGCAVEDGVLLLRGPTGVKYSKPPRVRDEFALKLARLETIAQEEAQRVFQRPLVRIEHVGTYVCRAIAGAPATASQHAFGNAIDITGFVLKGGRRISVARDFVRGGYTPAKVGGEFLARVLTRVQAEGLFRTVLTPDWDAKHADHLHLDDRPGGGWWRWRRLLAT
jgi:hypothetical protein